MMAAAAFVAPLLAVVALSNEAMVRGLAAARPARARVSVPVAVEPDFSRLVSDAEAFIEAEGIDFDGDEQTESPRPPRKLKKKRGVVRKPPKPSKVAKQRVGCYGCGADLQTVAPAAAGYVEPERYELKAVHRQLRLLICRRCRALTHGEILPAVVEGRLKAAPPLVDDAETAATATGASSDAASSDRDNATRTNVADI